MARAAAAAAPRDRRADVCGGHQGRVVCARPSDLPSRRRTWPTASDEIERFMDCMCRKRRLPMR